MWKRNFKVKSSNDPETVIGSGVNLTGDLNIKGPLTIHGNVHGQINSDDTVFIGDGAKVSGPVTSCDVTLAGEIEGNVIAKESLHLMSTGKLTGEIQTPSLSIDKGGVFNGACEMEAPSTPTPTQEPAPTPPSPMSHSPSKEEDEELKPPMPKETTYEMEE